MGSTITVTTYKHCGADPCSSSTLVCPVTDDDDDDATNVPRMSRVGVQTKNFLLVLYPSLKTVALSVIAMVS